MPRHRPAPVAPQSRVPVRAHAPLPPIPPARRSPPTAAQATLANGVTVNFVQHESPPPPVAVVAPLPPIQTVTPPEHDAPPPSYSALGYTDETRAQSAAEELVFPPSYLDQPELVTPIRAASDIAPLAPMAVRNNPFRNITNATLTTWNASFLRDHPGCEDVSALSNMILKAAGAYYGAEPRPISEQVIKSIKEKMLVVMRKHYDKPEDTLGLRDMIDRMIAIAEEERQLNFMNERFTERLWAIQDIDFGLSEARFVIEHERQIAAENSLINSARMGRVVDCLNKLSSIPSQRTKPHHNLTPIEKEKFELDILELFSDPVKITERYTAIQSVHRDFAGHEQMILSNRTAPEWSKLNTRMQERHGLMAFVDETYRKMNHRFARKLATGQDPFEVEREQRKREHLRDYTVQIHAIGDGSRLDAQLTPLFMEHFLVDIVDRCKHPEFGNAFWLSMYDMTCHRMTMVDDMRLENILATLNGIRPINIPSVMTT